MDSNYVGMIQCGGSLCLLNESVHAIAIASNFSRKNFQSNFAIEFHVLRQIHLAHSALANLRADFVAPEFGARGWHQLFNFANQLSTWFRLAKSKEFSGG